jgi:hypothetical protein
VTLEAAEASAKAGGPEMGNCTLALYRSAIDSAGFDWGDQLDAPDRRPGLVINASLAGA